MFRKEQFNIESRVNTRSAVGRRARSVTHPKSICGDQSRNRANPLFGGRAASRWSIPTLNHAITASHSLRPTLTGWSPTTEPACCKSFDCSGRWMETDHQSFTQFPVDWTLKVCVCSMWTVETPGASVQPPEMTDVFWGRWVKIVVVLEGHYGVTKRWIRCIPVARWLIHVEHFCWVIKFPNWTYKETSGM